MRAEHLLHGAPALFELRLGQVCQALRLDLEPLVDLLLRRDILIDVTCFVAQVQHHAIAHGLIVLVGVDVRPEDLDALLLILLEQRRAGETNQHRPRQQRLHRLVQFARLCAVAFIDENKHLAAGVEALRQITLDILDVGIDVLVAEFIARAELVNQ